MRYGILATLAIATLLGASAAATVAADSPQFQSARPIWPKDREKEMNLLVGFRAVINRPADGRAVLRGAAATIYRAWLNNEFLGCGPARGPHGYFRVDQWDLTGKLRPGKNVIAVEVAGYNCNSFYLLDQPSFLQAEVVAPDRVLASTAGAGQAFAARVLDERVQKVARYSFQRPFTEVYRLAPGCDRWRSEIEAPGAAVQTAVLPEKHFLPRRVLQPDFARHVPLEQVAMGHAEPIAMPQKPWKDRSLTNIGPKLKGFPENQLTVIPSFEAQALRFVPAAATKQAYSAAALELAPRQYRIFDLGVNRTGFLGAKVTCREKTRLWFLFDEILTHGDVDFKRLSCVNLVSYELAPGVYRLETIEPYTLRYLKLLCVEGRCAVEDVQLREYAHPPVPKAEFAASDTRLNQLFAAGVQTFRQNSLDLFMDCPSRERGGWLCDSFFTARTAFALTGKTTVERNFFENFLLPPRFEHLPDGMLPMCYPSDHNDGVYIPNWALWFVVELDEFAARAGDRQIVDGLRPRVLKLLDFFRRYENSDGLLEKLPSWVFVEWSAANRFVQDVNYPSNMLYAGALGAAARIYQLPELEAKAERIRATIRRQSFDGQFFVDNALRGKDGKLHVTRNRSEVCQYFAFFFAVATPVSHAELWHRLRDQFGPDRKTTHAFAEVHLANSFIGNMLRMELLSQAGRSQQILDESVAYLLYMADRTGTLWENTDAVASCNHGFASHIVHTLYRDVLGVRRIDPLRREVTIQIGDLPLEWCTGSVPTPDGPVRLGWWNRGDRIEYRLSVPAGYRPTIGNTSGKPLAALPENEAKGDTVIGDFSAGVPECWRGEGPTFGQKTPGTKLVPDWRERYSVERPSSGVLSSPPFTVARRYVNVRTCDKGTLHGVAGLVLLDTGTSHRDQLIRQSPRPELQGDGVLTWDVQDYLGTQAYFQLSDITEKDKVNLRSVILSDQPAADRSGRLEVRAAARAVIGKCKAVAEDPLRPVYHMGAAAGKTWDVNGCFYHNHAYHVIYLTVPPGLPACQAHLRSHDLLHWDQLPLAVWPGADVGEMDIYSGDATIGPDGKGYLAYTSVGLDRTPMFTARQGLAIAQDDGLLQWRKQSQPILTVGDVPFEIRHMRDPFFIKEDGRYYLAVTGQVLKEQYRAAFALAPVWPEEVTYGCFVLFTSDDMRHWRYLGMPLTSQRVKEWNGPLWEMSMLIKFGDRWLYTAGGKAYYTGRMDFQQARFTPEQEGRVTQGTFYAARRLQAADGRCLVWGHVDCGFRGPNFVKGANGWDSVISLPRVWTLDGEGRLQQRVADELQQLRGTHAQRRHVTLSGGSLPMNDAGGHTLEILAELKLGTAKRCGLELRRSADGHEGIRVGFDGTHVIVEPIGKELRIGPQGKGEWWTGQKYHLLETPANGHVKLHIFLDRGVLELFANDSLTFDRSIEHLPLEDVGLAAFADGGPAELVSLDTWQLHPISVSTAALEKAAQ